jgi:hypothetical protein
LSRASRSRWSRILTLLLAISLLLPLANSAASDVPQNEWHIQILIPRNTYYVGETVNLTGTISPPLSATVLLTFIVSDGSLSTFYVNSDGAGNFSFGKQFLTGSYSVFAGISSPQVNGNVTTDLVNFIIISKVQPPDSTTTTTQSSTLPSTTGTTTSTTQGENSSSQPQPSNTGWALNPAIVVAAFVIVVSAALLVVKLRHRA